MFYRFRLPDLLSGLLLALFASTGAAWAQTTNPNLNQSVPAVTVTLQVPTMAAAASTTIQLQIRTDSINQQTAMQVTSDANPSAPTIIAARVGGDSVATVPVDVSDAFVWAVSPNPTRPGCGPHPAAGTPGCSRADLATAFAQSGIAALGPAAPSPLSADSPVDVAGMQTLPPAPSISLVTSRAQTSASSAPVAPATSDPPATTSDPSPVESAVALATASAPALQYSVQPGDTLTAVARRFYGGGDVDALDHLVQTNLGQQMPDGRTFADANQIRPGWVLTLPRPTQVVYEQDGERWYVVQPGDTLSSIAARLMGSASRWPELYALNSERIAAPSRISVGVQLQLPDSQPAIAPAQAGKDDGAVAEAGHPQPDGTAPQQDAMGEASPNSAPDTAIPSTWSSSVSTSFEPTVSGGATLTEPPAAVSDQSASETSSIDDSSVLGQSELHPDRATLLPTAEIEEVLQSPGTLRLSLATATAADAMLLSSLTLGVWLFRRRRPAHFQTSPSPMAINSPVQLSSVTLGATALTGSRPRNHPYPSILPDPRAQRRARVLQAVLDGTLTHADAAEQLEVSTRQLRRLLAVYRVGGVDALRHANAGRVPGHAVADDLRKQIVDLVRTRYAGLSQSELAHRLATEHGIHLHRTTVRRIILAAELEANHAAMSATTSQAACDRELSDGSSRRAVQPGGGVSAGAALGWPS
jgi:nucleoid-associated protein YgaU/transposase